MAGPRQPLNLITAKGKSHMTKDEIREREQTEPQPVSGTMEPPKYLKSKLKKRWQYLSGELEKLGVMGTTDCDALARYVYAESEYEAVCTELVKIRGEMPKKPEDSEDRTRYYTEIKAWAEAVEATSKRQDRFFKQAHMAAGALGLTISSRCRLVVPKPPEKPKKNKFRQYLQEEEKGE